jgi:NADH-quinone oxidoreductase subunit L
VANLPEIGHEFDWTIGLISTLLALGGVGLAFVMYHRGEPQKLPEGVERMFSLSRHRLYVEEVYQAALVKPLGVLAFLAKAFDGFLDALARLISAIPRFVGLWVRPIQNGLVQFYALSMALGVTVLLMFVVFRVSH